MMFRKRKEKIAYEDYEDYAKRSSEAQRGDVMLRAPFPDTDGSGAVFVSKKRAIEQVPGRTNRIRYYNFRDSGFGISGIEEGQYGFNKWKKLLVENGFWNNPPGIEGVTA